MRYAGTSLHTEDKGPHGLQLALQMHGSWQAVFLEMDAPLRSDESFRAQQDDDHHHGTSILTELPIDCVKVFSLDFMHLCCLGVVGKLLRLLAFGPRGICVGPAERGEILAHLEPCRQYVPKEIARRPRSLKYLEHWKATEFRVFVHFLGPAVLAHRVTDRAYLNFISLHCAILILASEGLCKQQNAYARELLMFFVQSFLQLYGKRETSHNVHSLIHLADDVNIHGPLDSFSAFPFESNMKLIKRLLRKADRSLEQLFNQMAEIEAAAGNAVSQGAVDTCPKLVHDHSDGPLLQACRPPQYQAAELPSFVFSLEKSDNSCMVDGDIIEIHNIAVSKHSGKPCLIGQKFLQFQSLYMEPFEYSRLGIGIVRNRSPLRCWPTQNVQELVRLPFGDSFAVVPLVHTAHFPFHSQSK